jgi:hypothetical protein
MLMIAAIGAALGSAVGVKGAFGLVLGLRWTFPILLTTWATWFIVGLIATFDVARRGSRNVVRFGPWGLTRARWWFEVARLAWLFTLMDILFLGFAATPWMHGVRLFTMDAANAAFMALGPAVAAWMLTTTVGYCLAWILWAPLRGKAFECVHYFFTIIGSITLGALGVYLWDPNVSFIQLAFAAVLALAGAVLLLAGFISIVRRYERRVRKSAFNDGRRMNEDNLHAATYFTVHRAGD